MDPFNQTRTVGTAMGPLLFRPVRPGDEAELLCFFCERLSPRSRYLFCPHDPSDPVRCREQFAERIRRHRDREDLTLVVERDGAIVGYFFLWHLFRSDGLPPVLGIGLADELHGERIGGAMMDYLLECARALGIPAVELTHESTNERAARLYASRGFVYTGAEQRQGPDSARIERVMRWTAG